MKTVDLGKLEAALLCAITQFWPNRPPRFSLSFRTTASDGARNIGIILHARSEPINVIEVAEADLQDRTAAVVTRCAQKMTVAWTDWTNQQLGVHDLSKAFNATPYEKIAATFPLVRWDLADIFEKDGAKS